MHRVSARREREVTLQDLSHIAGYGVSHSYPSIAPNKQDLITHLHAIAGIPMLLSPPSSKSPA